MKKWICQTLLAGGMLAASATLAQSGYTLDFIGKVNFPAIRSNCAGTDTTGGSDVWGYTAPDGSEYAIMGVRDGIAFVKIPELQVIQVVPGPKNSDCYYHRDIQTYGHYAYAVSEMSGTNQGMMIIDMSPLPDSVRFAGSYSIAGNVRSHNMHIDTATGYAYVIMQNASGVRVLSLADPENPVQVNQVITPPQFSLTHDVYARNDTMYVSEGTNGSFSIWDMADKLNPQFLARIDVPSGGYAHNAWPSDDGRYLMTTEETNNRTVKLWDIGDMSNITLAGEYLAPNLLAHNTHIKGNWAVLSHYSYGVTVVDISNPAQLLEIASYDTYPRNNNPGFFGCWGAYPYTQENFIYASNFNGDLVVLQLREVVSGTGDAGPGVAAGTVLQQNYPNPFNPATTIRYSLERAAGVRLTIYNSLGQRVYTTREEPQAAGMHEVRWDARDRSGNLLPSGSYFYQISISGKHRYDITRRMLLLR